MTGTLMDLAAIQWSLWLASTTNSFSLVKNFKDSVTDFTLLRIFEVFPHPFFHCHFCDNVMVHRTYSKEALDNDNVILLVSSHSHSATSLNLFRSL